METQNNNLQIETTELNSLEKSKAQQIKEVFEPMAEMIKNFETVYGELLTEVASGITEELSAKAKRLRLGISKVRINAEKARKEQKAEYLRAGKAIDGVANILKWAVEEKENKLREIENHFILIEQERLKKLQQDRAEKLSAYVDDADQRDLTKFEEDEFNALLEFKKKEKEDRIKAEKQAEAERLAKEKAEAEERERIRKENEKLKAEAKERERKEKEERERLAKIQAAEKAKQEAERKAREKKELEQKKAYEAKIKAEREEKERIEREEREKREKLEKKLKAIQEAEQLKREQEEARKQAELNKGDVAKVQDLINDLKSLKTKYVFKSQKNKQMYLDVNILLDKIIEHI